MAILFGFFWGHLFVEGVVADEIFLLLQHITFVSRCHRSLPHFGNSRLFYMCLKILVRNKLIFFSLRERACVRVCFNFRQFDLFGKCKTFYWICQ